MPELTGRYLVVFREDAPREAIDQVTGGAGMNITHSDDFSMGMNVEEALQRSDGVYFDELKVAILQAPPQQPQGYGMEAFGLDATPGPGSIVASEPERYVYASAELARRRAVAAASLEETREYARGYRDATSHLYEQLFGGDVQEDDPENLEVAVVKAKQPKSTNAPPWKESETCTWGLVATRADVSKFTGSGISVAVLDTGMTMDHPDFAGRQMVTRSFIKGETIKDENGHGTHCTGTSMGPAKTSSGRRRYGVAGEALLHAAKVLGNDGTGTDGDVLAAIDWAIKKGCRIVSMSLSGPTEPGEAPSAVYEEVAKRALAKNCLIIAAAGNDSWRPQDIINPVARPANCPSIMAVGAIDQNGKVAGFSNRGIDVTTGGEVDIAGPGVSVFSSWTMPREYHWMNGTSMATPHVSGIAALYLQKEPNLTATELWKKLMEGALKLAGQRDVDVGAGLVQSV